MATQENADNKTRKGLGRSLTRVKSYVKDMKNLKNDFHRWRGARKEGERSKQPSPSQDWIPTAAQTEASVLETTSVLEAESMLETRSVLETRSALETRSLLETKSLLETTSILETTPVPETTSVPETTPVPEATSVPETASVSETRSSQQDSRHVRSLSVRVTVSFGEPLNYAHTQDYEASSSLQPTEELCEALIRRVDHCSKELITRRDSNALDRTGSDGLAKPMRYEIQLQVLRNETGTATETWASRTLRSYQKQPLGTETAREVILSSHYMVGLFLRHHDEAFVWKDGPVREDSAQEQKTFPYRPGRVQPLTTIPRSFFIEKQHDFQSSPGYSICLSFTSQNHHRTPRRWQDTMEVHSNQLSPLTLTAAENLFLDACYSVDGVFKSERKEFEALQASCAGHSGCQHCRQHDGDGVGMTLSVKNNVGPLFDNLERTTWSSTNIFWRSHATDCTEFVERAKEAIVQVCRDTDQTIAWMNDFEFYIIELRGRGWTIEEPLAFTLGPESCLDRRTVESLLDRLQTGVADVLRGNAITVRMTARKRGHFILHKTLVAREPFDSQESKKKPTEKSKAYVLDRLKKRIERDIDMVCKDTCTIASQDNEAVKSDLIVSAPSQYYNPMHTGLVSLRRPSDITAPPKRPFLRQRDSTAERMAARARELLETASDQSSISSSNSDQFWNNSTRDPATGVRKFPLMPSRRSSQPLGTLTSRNSSTRQNKFSRYDTTDTSTDVSTNGERIRALRSETTSGASTSNTEPEAYLTGPHKHAKEGSVASIRLQTPELEFSGSPSIRSSILITPKIYEQVLEHELDITRKPTPECEAIESDGSAKVDNPMRKLYINRAVSSLLSRLALLDGSSTLPSTAEIRPIPTERLTIGSSNEETSLSREKAPSRSGFKAKASTDLKPTKDNVLPANIISEPIITAPTPKEEHHYFTPPTDARHQEYAHIFSQTKPDFDFTTSSEASEAVEAASTSSTPTKTSSNSMLILHPSKQVGYQDPDPSEIDDNRAFILSSSPPAAASSLPSSPRGLNKRPSRSLGTGSYLSSFHEQKFYAVGLRRAPSPTPLSPAPFTRLSFHDDEGDVADAEGERLGGAVTAR